MIIFNEDNQILLEYQQHATIKNKERNYKELTIPSDIYKLWVQRNNDQPVKEAALITIFEDGTVTSYITPVTAAAIVEGNHIITPTGEHKISNNCLTTTLKIRINKSRPNKAGKQKQKATMTITKAVMLQHDDVKFILDPNTFDFGSNYHGLCSVEGIVVNPDKEKKVGKEKKHNNIDIEPSKNKNKDIPGGIAYLKQNYEYLQKKQQKKLQQKEKTQQIKEYVEGNKNDGYYIVNAAEGINIGAYLTNDDVKADVDNLLNNGWNKEAVETSKLNVEYYITEKGFPYIREYNFYYCLNKSDYEKMEKDVHDNTPFTNISYEALQKIIHDSINYEDQ